MKLSWSKTHALAASAALVVVTNAVALIGVAYNRSGEPDSTLTLTERELSLANWDWLDSDNSGIDLRIDWSVQPRPVEFKNEKDDPYDWREDLDWLTNDDLLALGFDVTKPLDTKDGERHYQRALPRPAFFVLEFDGPAHQIAIANAQARAQRAAQRAATNPDDKELKENAASARRRFDRETRIASRLYLVDVGADRDALRARHPDRSHYAIVSGQVRIGVYGPEHRRRLGAEVAGVNIATINVPHAYRATVASLLVAPRVSYDSESPPRYQAMVNFGRRLEPWIVDLQRIDNPEHNPEP